MESELSCTPKKRGRGGTGGGAVSPPFPLLPPLVFFFFSREFFSRALLSERLEQAKNHVNLYNYFLIYILLIVACNFFLLYFVSGCCVAQPAFTEDLIEMMRQLIATNYINTAEMQPTMFNCLGITFFYYSTVNFYLQLQTLHLIPHLVNNVAYVCTLLKV